MNLLQKLLMECELDADALVAKLERASAQAAQFDAHAERRLDNMADFVADIADELAALAGHPRDVPDYHQETRR